MRTRAEIEAEAKQVREDAEDDIFLCQHHNQKLIPGKRRAMEKRLAELRVEWRRAGWAGQRPGP